MILVDPYIYSFMFFKVNHKIARNAILSKAYSIPQISAVKCQSHWNNVYFNGEPSSSQWCIDEADAVALSHYCTESFVSFTREEGRLLCKEFVYFEGIL